MCQGIWYVHLYLSLQSTTIQSTTLSYIVFPPVIQFVTKLDPRVTLKTGHQQQPFRAKGHLWTQHPKRSPNICCIIWSPQTWYSTLTIPCRLHRKRTYFTWKCTQNKKKENPNLEKPSFFRCTQSLVFGSKALMLPKPLHRWWSSSCCTNPGKNPQSFLFVREKNTPVLTSFL